MNIKHILRESSHPAPYTPGTAEMWVDEYISRQLLQVHLDQDIELASRKKSTIEKTLRWIFSHETKSALSVLDLGCGPGLYTEEMARAGHHVTGIDFSAHSIEYARSSAQRKQLDISYRNQNYLTLEDENHYDLIIMIFTDFGVLTPHQRSTLLARINRALKPGGTFIFDVLNTTISLEKLGARNWEMAAGGFWRPGPYLALSDSIYYAKEDVTLNQHIVMAEDDTWDIYRFWVHTFTPAELDHLLIGTGFAEVQCYDNIIPDSALCASEAVTFCRARK